MLIPLPIKKLFHYHLKKHLKGEDFFEVDKYPTAVLKIINSKNFINDEVEVYGNLTIKKTTKPIIFKIKQLGNNFFGKITIDRTLFGVQYNSKSFFDNLGDQAIKNEFDLAFSLVEKI